MKAITCNLYPQEVWKCPICDTLRFTFRDLVAHMKAQCSFAPKVKYVKCKSHKRYGV